MTPPRLPFAKGSLRSGGHFLKGEGNLQKGKGADGARPKSVYAFGAATPALLLGKSFLGPIQAPSACEFHKSFDWLPNVRIKCRSHTCQDCVEVRSLCKCRTTSLSSSRSPTLLVVQQGNLELSSATWRGRSRLVHAFLSKILCVLPASQVSSHTCRARHGSHIAAPTLMVLRNSADKCTLFQFTCMLSKQEFHRVGKSSMQMVKELHCICALLDLQALRTAGTSRYRAAPSCILPFITNFAFDVQYISLLE